MHTIRPSRSCRSWCSHNSDLSRRYGSCSSPGTVWKSQNTVQNFANDNNYY